METIPYYLSTYSTNLIFLFLLKIAIYLLQDVPKGKLHLENSTQNSPKLWNFKSPWKPKNMLENILSQSCLVFWNIRVTEPRFLIKQKNGTKLKFLKFFPSVIINCILVIFHNVRPHKATYRRWVMMAHISWWTKLKGLVARQGSNITPFTTSSHMS